VVIKPGREILSFISVKSKPYLIYDVLRFRAVNQKHEAIDFQYLVPQGTIPPAVIRDLLHFTKTHEFVLVELVSGKDMLQIKSIRELKTSEKVEFTLK
jgi:hypothetical protein